MSADLSYRRIEEYPHDPFAFTQGLVHNSGVLFESVGLYGSSEIRQVELKTGRILRRKELSATCFAEGIAVQGDQLYQLTWKERRAFVYRKHDLSVVNEFHYETEGWGLAAAGDVLIMSDGTSTLYTVGQTSGQKPLVEVRDGDRPVSGINDLVAVNGLLYANIWHSERIAVIDIRTGSVVHWIDLSGIDPFSSEPHSRPTEEAVMNGIAYDATSNRLLVTGKLWPSLYAIEISPGN
ncbi:glutaminyl-peptide cyclotransferase [Streptomyces sp. NPDC001127]|uniref:glutaminyl-peptide cyclotransferase n=1 Tax=Streptomyces sp. NPDC001127 TaxID=3154377 RepID=UPI003332C09B